MTDLFAAYKAHLVTAGWSPITITDRLELLRRLDDDLDHGLAQATTEQIEAWLARPGWSQNTRCTYDMHIRAFFGWAAARQRRLDNPAAALPRPRQPVGVPRPVTHDQLAVAMAGSDHRWRIILALAAYAGLRCCEIAVLERAHVTAAVLRVVGKGGKPATVPMHPALWELVRDEPDGLLARTAAGRPFRDLSAAARAHFRKLGLFGVGLHKLRAWFGTMVYRAEHDLLVAQRALRHASPVTTTRYTLLDDDALRGTIGALPWVA